MAGENIETKEATPSIVPNAVPDFEKITDLQVHSSKPAPVEKQPEKVAEAAKTKDADGVEDADQDTKDKVPAAKAEDSKEDKDLGQEPEDEIEIPEEQIDELVSQRFEGKYKSLDEIQEKLERLEELEKNPAPKFQSDSHKKLYEFVSKYGGKDFGTGIQNFARLQSIEDVSKLNAKDALRELYIQENPDLSREDAELVFEDDYEKKDPEKIEDAKAQKIAKIKLDKEALSAREKLSDLKNQTLVADEKTNTAEMEKDIADYKGNVAKSMTDFDRITISPDEKNPDSEFNFDFENSKDVAQAMTDFDFHCEKMGWVNKGIVNFDKMKVDYAFMYNRDAIILNSINHGKELGKLELTKEMENRDPKKKESSSQGKVNKTKEEAMDEAILNLPSR